MNNGREFWTLFIKKYLQRPFSNDGHEFWTLFIKKYLQRPFSKNGREFWTLKVFFVVVKINNSKDIEYNNNKEVGIKEYEKHDKE